MDWLRLIFHSSVWTKLFCRTFPIILFIVIHFFKIYFPFFVRFIHSCSQIISLNGRKDLLCSAFSRYVFCSAFAPTYSYFVVVVDAILFCCVRFRLQFSSSVTFFLLHFERRKTSTVPCIHFTLDSCPARYVKYMGMLALFPCRLCKR